METNKAIKMLEAKLECMKRDVSGCDNDCNRRLCGECHLNYEQGNMGEQEECLQMSIDVLKFFKQFFDGTDKTIKDSSFTVHNIEEKNTLDALYGMDTYRITKFDIKSLLEGKILYTDENGEYAAIILLVKEGEENE